jgi:hypothetical protein
LITNCGGKAFLVNDITCTNNVICDSRFAGNAQGGLAQAVANLVLIRAAVGQTSATQLDAALPSSRRLPDPIIATQTVPKALLIRE